MQRAHGLHPGRDFVPGCIGQLRVRAHGILLYDFATPMKWSNWRWALYSDKSKLAVLREYKGAHSRERAR